MRARDRDLPQGPGAEFGLANGLVGIGDGQDAKAERMIRAFAELPDGVFVWTRASDGAYHLGRVRGPWRYDDSDAAAEVGIHHVRSATWLDRPFGEHEVPAAVAETFARGGRNLQRTHSEAAERRTAELWAEHAG
jgi:hypothetical protein